MNVVDIRGLNPDETQDKIDELQQILDKKRINVLNGGFVRLVDHMGDDLAIVRAARVSYNADWRTGENEKSDEGLIKYLMKNRHTSPFESVTFKFEVKAPIFVFRQWHRHRTWSYSEISARYTELDEGFYIPDANKIGLQSKDNKQVRDINTDAEVTKDQEASRWIIECACQSSFQLYISLLERGVPRELARSVLPVAAYSRMFATVDLHNLLHFLRLRLHTHSQYEIRVYAEAILQLIRPIVPVTISEFEKTLI